MYKILYLSVALLSVLGISGCSYNHYEAYGETDDHTQYITATTLKATSHYFPYVKAYIYDKKTGKKVTQCQGKLVSDIIYNAYGIVYSQDKAGVLNCENGQNIKGLAFYEGSGTYKGFGTGILGYDENSHNVSYEKVKLGSTFTIYFALNVKDAKDRYSKHSNEDIFAVSEQQLQSNLD